MKFIQIALLGAATLAVAEPHNHVHRHGRRGSPLQGRYATTTTVAGPIKTVYELNGQQVPEQQVEEGLKDGKYVLVGERISTIIDPTTSSTTSTSTTPIPSTTQAAQFVETSASTTSTPPPPPPTTTAAPAPPPPPPAPAPALADNSAANSGAGLNAPFQSGVHACSEFPSQYGAVAAMWLGLGGWTGVQQTSGFHPGAASISSIETAIAGGGCTANSFCSYACPPGFQKSQWPSAQGNTGQSIGGLYCNSNGVLELSRPSVNTICIPGVGGVQARSSLSKNVAICRTDYPGTEGETIATNVPAGATVEITCPDASNYYVWENGATSGQYYINPSGYSVEDACQWGSAGSNLGNWAPLNMGVGRGLSGETFISLFPNHPTNMNGRLDFNIKITGGVSGSCSYSHSDNMYYSNGAASPNGCTVSVSGTATYEFSY